MQAASLIVLESATVSDAAEILVVQKLAFQGQAVLYDDYTLPPLVQTPDELAGDFDRYSFLKATLAGRIIGSVRGRWEGEVCHVSRLLVHPEHQNKGVGTLLMHAIEERFRDARRYALFTGHLSAKNLALYAKLGYREFGRKPQSDKVVLICMEKSRR